MKRIFLWGDYTHFDIFDIKITKAPEDFIIVTIEDNGRPSVSAVKYIANTEYVPGYMSMFHFFKKERPDYLAVVEGHKSMETIQEFHKVKNFCDGLDAELITLPVKGNFVTMSELLTSFKNAQRVLA